MASNGRHDQTISPLGRYWDAVVHGQPADPGDLDPALAATVRHLHARDDAPGANPTFAARLLADLEEQMPTLDPGPTLTLEPRPWPIRTAAPTNDPVSVWRLPMSRQPFRGSLAQIASVALVIITLTTAYLVFGPPRSPRHEGQPAPLPALLTVATLTAGEPSVATLLDVTTEALPTGHLVVAVERLELPPGSAPVRPPANSGSVMMLVPESGQITAVEAGTPHPLAAGKALTLGDAALTLQASGPEAATLLAISISAELPTDYWTIDSLTQTNETLISTSAEHFPGGPSRLLLERLTVPPGSALPAGQASPFVWTEVGAGALGLTLEGEHLPFRWKSGTERTFRPGQSLPSIQPGTQMTLRNAGDDPLVLYRLTLSPSAAQASAAGTPTS